MHVYTDDMCACVYSCHVWMCVQLSKNPYMYNKHIELIKALKELGELERLREARRTMQEQFPLSDGQCVIFI